MSTLVFFHLLADRHGAPAALLFEQGDAPQSAADPDDAAWGVVDVEALRALSAEWPCFYPAQLAPASAAPLRAAGWRALDAAGVLRTDAPMTQAAAPPAAGPAWIVGHWCLAPPATAPSRQGASGGSALQLAHLVARDADTHEIEALLRHDPALSYHLLRLVNAPGIGNGRRVTSFAQAILMLGRQQLKRWLNLMLFAARADDVRSRMLLARVAVRARAMELLARAGGMPRPVQEQAFMAGMFSLLGVLFGLPLAELLQPLLIGEAVQAALLARDGELGALLLLMEAAERGDFAAVAVQLQALQTAPREFNQVMLDANLWSLAVLREGADAHA